MEFHPFLFCENIAFIANPCVHVLYNHMRTVTTQFRFFQMQMLLFNSFSMKQAWKWFSNNNLIPDTFFRISSSSLITFTQVVKNMKSAPDKKACSIVYRLHILQVWPSLNNAYEPLRHHYSLCKIKIQKM